MTGIFILVLIAMNGCIFNGAFSEYPIITLLTLLVDSIIIFYIVKSITEMINEKIASKQAEKARKEHEEAEKRRQSEEWEKREKERIQRLEYLKSAVGVAIKKKKDVIDRFESNVSYTDLMIQTEKEATFRVHFNDGHSTCMNATRINKSYPLTLSDGSTIWQDGCCFYNGGRCYSKEELGEIIREYYGHHYDKYDEHGASYTFLFAKLK